MHTIEHFGQTGYTINIEYKCEVNALNKQVDKNIRYSLVLLSSKKPRFMANKIPYFRELIVIKYLLAMSEAIAIVGEGKHLTFMSQPVQKSCSENRIAEEVGPAVKALV